MQILLISSVIPADTTGGEIVLYRHLCGSSVFSLTVVDRTPPKNAAEINKLDLLNYLQNTRFSFLAETFRVLRRGRRLDRITRLINANSVDVVMTVAHGEAFCAAQRFAKRNKLPLVSIFHDWWPDIPILPRAVCKLLDSDFRKLANSSSLVLSVSEGMHRELGHLPNSVVLYPIADSFPINLNSKRNPSKSNFRIGYMGNLFTYSDMLKNLIEISKVDSQIKVEIRGRCPQWTKQFQELATEQGNLLGFAERDEMRTWLQGLDAYLITMTFDLSMKRRMETSFPSKITEFARFGKPLVIWGPEYCSAVQWARNGDKAICVTNPSPTSVLDAIRDLQKDNSKREKYSHSARVASETEFNPEKIQSLFVELLREAVRNWNKDGIVDRSL